MQYFTVGTEERPTYSFEDDPQHCFHKIEEAQAELKFLKKEMPELKLTSVWFIQGLFHASKQDTGE